MAEKGQLFMQSSSNLLREKLERNKNAVFVMQIPLKVIRDQI